MSRVIEKTVYKFSELSERAKQRAREAYTGGGYLDYEWWDCTFEDAVTCAELLGIKIDVDGGQKRSATRPMIYFSVGGSQGDGASFSGDYTCRPNAIAAITAHAPLDEELLRIAQALQAVQIVDFVQRIDSGLVRRAETLLA